MTEKRSYYCAYNFFTGLSAFAKDTSAIYNKWDCIIYYWVKGSFDVAFWGQEG